MVDSLFINIPSGVGSKRKDLRLSHAEIKKVLAKGAGWAVKKGYGLDGDLEYIEERGCIRGADPGFISKRALERGRAQLGTLGSGNHFVEVGFVEEIYDAPGANHNVDGWSYIPGNNTLWDPLGLYHSDSCTFSFMDGHAEEKKWTDKRTLIYWRSRAKAASMGFGKGTQFNPPNEDLKWLDEHYPGKTRLAQ